VWRSVLIGSDEEIIAMADGSSHEEAQLQARLTVLELVVGMIVRENMLKSGKGPADILAFGETVKKFLSNRTPTGASDQKISEAADKFFSAIASDVGSQDSQ
jgi:hypothetical protein